LINVSLVIGNFARTSWWNYPPLSELAFSPDVGVDYYLWSVQISGIGTLLTGVNFVTTILTLHAPGMTYFRMPGVRWTTMATNMTTVAAVTMLALNSYKESVIKRSVIKKETTESSEPRVLYSVANQIARVVMIRPAIMNAMGRFMIAELRQSLE